MRNAEASLKSGAVPAPRDKGDVIPFPRMKEERGAAVRAVSRAVAVLQAVNRHGSLSIVEIAREVDLPYPTTARIVQTLQIEGLIERELGRKRYRATALVQTLSHGYQADDRLATVARPHIVALTNKMSWPVSITTRVGQKMMVRDSTHALTSMTLNNYYPGYTLPILECAAGRAYLAFCPDDERVNIISGLQALSSRSADAAWRVRIGEGPRGDTEVQSFMDKGCMLEEIRRLGFATKVRNLFTENPGKTSSIAVPIREGQKVIGCLSVVFFSFSLKMEEAISRFESEIKRTAVEIEQGISSLSSVARL